MPHVENAGRTEVKALLCQSYHPHRYADQRASWKTGAGPENSSTHTRTRTSNSGWTSRVFQLYPTNIKWHYTENSDLIQTICPGLREHHRCPKELHWLGCKPLKFCSLMAAVGSCQGECSTLFHEKKDSHWWEDTIIYPGRCINMWRGKLSPPVGINCFLFIAL